MGITNYPSLSFALLLSLSFATAYTNPSNHFSLQQFKPRTKPKASASDLISLLGPPQQASTVNATEAQQLQSCFKFLVPFSPIRPGPQPLSISTRRALYRRRGSVKKEEEYELVWWPPPAVMDLARIAVDSGGDPAAIQRTLDPTKIPVPDIEGSNENRCQLTRTPYGWNFISEELNSYLEFLFEIIADRGPDVGLNVSLNRYDFFHGHIFLASGSGRLGPDVGLNVSLNRYDFFHGHIFLASGSGRLGILFHAKEYPAFDKETFPYNMGYCQIGSDVTYDDSMNLRNILWLAPLPSTSSKAWLAPGVLVVLDARPDGIIYRDLIPKYAHYVRTLYEDDFGDIVADVNYLNCGSATPNYKIFIC